MSPALHLCIQWFTGTKKIFALRGRDRGSPVTPYSEVFCMKLVSPAEKSESPSIELETLTLSAQQLDFLERVSSSVKPAMPAAFGWPIAIRMILDRIEQSGIDLTDAASEQEIVELAAGRLRQRKTRGRRASAPSASLASNPSATRRVYRSSLPETDRRRSGRRPRSGHG